MRSQAATRPMGSPGVGAVTHRESQSEARCRPTARSDSREARSRASDRNAQRRRRAAPRRRRDHIGFANFGAHGSARERDHRGTQLVGGHDLFGGRQVDFVRRGGRCGRSRGSGPPTTTAATAVRAPVQCSSVGLAGVGCTEANAKRMREAASAAMAACGVGVRPAGKGRSSTVRADGNHRTQHRHRHRQEFTTLTEIGVGVQPGVSQARTRPADAAGEPS